MPKVLSDVITYSYSEEDIRALIAKDLGVNAQTISTSFETDYNGYPEGLKVAIDKKKEK